MEGDSEESGESEARFAAYVESLASVLGNVDRVALLNDYCTGLLMPGEKVYSTSGASGDAGDALACSTFSSISRSLSRPRHICILARSRARRPGGRPAQSMSRRLTSPSIAHLSSAAHALSRGPSRESRAAAWVLAARRSRGTRARMSASPPQARTARRAPASAPIPAGVQSA